MLKCHGVLNQICHSLLYVEFASDQVSCSHQIQLGPHINSSSPCPTRFLCFYPLQHPDAAPRSIVLNYHGPRYMQLLSSPARFSSTYSTVLTSTPAWGHTISCTVCTSAPTLSGYQLRCGIYISSSSVFIWDPVQHCHHFHFCIYIISSTVLTSAPTLSLYWLQCIIHISSNIEVTSSHNSVHISSSSVFASDPVKGYMVS